jgi:metal-responsive CopG/Arc/MetJ family transcriptional regulator
MLSTKPLTVTLPPDLLREAMRFASTEATTPNKLIEAALRQYLTSHRWQRLRQWGAETAKQLGLKNEADLERFLARDRTTARLRRR